MAERLAHDIARNLRSPGPWPSVRLLCEAADKLEGLIELLAEAETARDLAETERDEAHARVVELHAQLGELKYAHVKTLNLGQWEIRVTCVDQDCSHGDRCEHDKVHSHVWRSPWRPGGHYENREINGVFVGAVCPDGVFSNLKFDGKHTKLDATDD